MIMLFTVILMLEAGKFENICVLSFLYKLHFESHVISDFGPHLYAVY